jgi:nucleoid-associated protein YgaU
MIERTSHNSGVSPAAAPTQRAASTKTLCHTPFGDVMVNELSTPNLAGLLSGSRPAARRALAVAQPTVAAPAAQAATAAVTMKAAVAATTAQTASSVATAPSTAQTEAATDATQPADSSSAPTAESVFGPTPWATNPTGMAPDGSSYGYNPMYFASAATAAKVAQMVGGKVVTSNQFTSADGPFQQQQPNQMVQLANGTLINPGLVAGFYTHGYPQSYIDFLV